MTLAAIYFAFSLAINDLSFFKLVLPKPPLSLDEGGSDVEAIINGVAARSKINWAIFESEAAKVSHLFVHTIYPIVLYYM